MIRNLIYIYIFHFATDIQYCLKESGCTNLKTAECHLEIADWGIPLLKVLPNKLDLKKQLVFILKFRSGAVISSVLDWCYGLGRTEYLMTYFVEVQIQLSLRNLSCVLRRTTMLLKIRFRPFCAPTTELNTGIGDLSHRRGGRQLYICCTVVYSTFMGDLSHTPIDTGGHQLYIFAVQIVNSWATYPIKTGSRQLYI